MRPTAKEMIVLAEPWRPWRGVAARVLWTYYRAAKGREGAPIEPAKAPAKTAKKSPKKPPAKPKRTARRSANGRRA